MGFANIKQTKATGNMAVDLFAEKDGESHVIECKKYNVTHKVSRRDLMLLESVRHYFKRTEDFYKNVLDVISDVKMLLHRHSFSK